MELQLIRTYNEQGTNGELFINGKKIGNTIELPWKNNQGVYQKAENDLQFRRQHLYRC